MAKDKEDKLAQDAAAARAANMSYGKWKGLNGQTPVEDKLKDGWKICEWCGAKYFPRTGQNRKYCDAYCCTEASKARTKKARAEAKRKEEQNAVSEVQKQSSVGT